LRGNPRVEISIINKMASARLATILRGRRALLASHVPMHRQISLLKGQEISFLHPSIFLPSPSIFSSSTTPSGNHRHSRVEVACLFEQTAPSNGPGLVNDKCWKPTVPVTHIWKATSPSISLLCTRSGERDCHNHELPPSPP